MTILLLLACGDDHGDGEFTDADGDGYGPPEDCNDDDKDVRPDVLDFCDGTDNNCVDGEFDCGQRWSDLAETVTGPVGLTLHAVDLDGSGALDVLSSDGATVSLILDPVAGNREVQSITSTGEFGARMISGDFDGDDVVDLAVSHGASVEWAYGPIAAGAWVPAGVVDGTGGLASGDIDGDGLDDLLATEVGAVVDVFDDTVLFTNDTTVQSLVTGDYTGDGLDDIAIAYADNNAIAWLEVFESDGTGVQSILTLIGGRYSQVEMVAHLGDVGGGDPLEAVLTVPQTFGGGKVFLLASGLSGQIAEEDATRTFISAIRFGAAVDADGQELYVTSPDLDFVGAPVGGAYRVALEDETLPAGDAWFGDDLLPLTATTGIAGLGGGVFVTSRFEEAGSREFFFPQ